jgi:hypothetical protein
MADIVQGKPTRPRDQVALAIVLIVVGVLGLASRYLNLSESTGGWIVAIIGLGLLGAFAYTLQYGYLVPGGIMTGLGAGIIGSQTFTFASDETASGAIVLGLGAGFVAIWVIGSLLNVARNHWWPLVPGGILAFVGTVLLIGGQAANVLDYWGVAWVVVGLFVLWRAWSGRRAGT